MKAKGKQQATDLAFEDEPAIGPRNIELDIEVICYARDLEEQSSGLSSQKDNMPENSPNDR